MACSTPVITSDCSCMPEIASNAALMINPKDDDELSEAILRLSTDKNLHHQLTQAGLQRQQNFSWDIAGNRTLNVYREVAS